MFYLGVLSSVIALLYPVEALEKADQTAEYLDIIRFYIHHIIIDHVNRYILTKDLQFQQLIEQV